MTKSDYIVFFRFFSPSFGASNMIYPSPRYCGYGACAKTDYGNPWFIATHALAEFLCLGLKVFERNRERIMKGIGVKMVRICWSGYSGHQNPCSICSMIHVCPGTLWRVHGAKTAWPLRMPKHCRCCGNSLLAVLRLDCNFELSVLVMASLLCAFASLIVAELSVLFWWWTKSMSEGFVWAAARYGELSGNWLECTWDGGLSDEECQGNHKGGKQKCFHSMLQWSPSKRGFPL